MLVQPLVDHLLAHESDATSPARRSVVQHIVNAEPALVSLGQLVELLLQQDILKVDVSVDEIDFFGGVLGVVQDVRDDLVHGCDAGSACEHAEFGNPAWGVLELSLGSANADFLADLELSDVFGDVALFVALKNTTSEMRN